MNPTLVPAPVTPPGPAAMPTQGASPLAAAMMGHGSMPQGQNPLGGIPLSSMMQLLTKPGASGVSPLNQFTNGMGNLFSGYNWNGMPGSAAMGGLSAQAGNNIMTGAAGL
jgi:hypothetical protein